MPRAIITADDFGVSSVVNRAIEDCLRKGLCSHASLMANMPGFEEACELSHCDTVGRTELAYISFCATDRL